MNPIEKAYSKLKAYLRKIAERTVTGLMRALEAYAGILKPAECENYFAACGYASSKLDGQPLLEWLDRRRLTGTLRAVTF